MNLKFILKLLGFGFLLFILWMVSLFIVSMFIPAPTLEPGQVVTDYSFYNIAGVVEAVVMGVGSFLFSKLLKVKNVKRALICGLSWTLFNFILLFIIAVGNQTTQVVFGTWLAFLPFLAIAFMPLLNSINKKSV